MNGLGSPACALICGHLRGINEVSRTHKEQMWHLLSRTQGRCCGDGEDPSGQVTGSIAQTEGTNKKRRQENEQGPLCDFQVFLKVKLTVGETR